jgi:hypothetical protein
MFGVIFWWEDDVVGSGNYGGSYIKDSLRILLEVLEVVAGPSSVSLPWFKVMHTWE